MARVFAVNIGSFLVIRTFLLAGVCLPILLLCALDARAGDDLPPVFDRRPYAVARKSAADAKKWFIVKATADWCGPCKRMDKTTWRDETVVTWVRANAVLVAVDVDEEPQLAKALGIEAMPTMIAFKEGGEEFDRIVGYRGPEATLAWLEDVAKGEKSIEAVRKRAEAPAGERVDVQAKLALAEALTQQHRYSEAADEFLWLWKNMLQHERGMYGVRLSFMAGDMKELARQSKEAREKFVAMRDETGKRLEGGKVDVEDVVDWVVLNNRVLDDTDATVKWYERVKDQRKWRSHVDRVSRDLADMFIELGRWPDVGRLSTDPLAELESSWALFKMTQNFEPPKSLSKEDRERISELDRRRFREGAGQLYAGLLAAAREDTAAKVAERAREYDPSSKMLRALVETALDADQPRQEQREWLEGAKDESLSDLSRSVAEALKTKTPER